MSLYNIPIELRKLNQWVCVKGDSKIPINVNTSTPASSTDPSTWCSFDNALTSIKDGRYDYIETGSLISIKKNVANIFISFELSSSPNATANVDAKII